MRLKGLYSVGKNSCLRPSRRKELLLHSTRSSSSPRLSHYSSMIVMGMHTLSVKRRSSSIPTRIHSNSVLRPLSADTVSITDSWKCSCSQQETLQRRGHSVRWLTRNLLAKHPKLQQHVSMAPDMERSTEVILLHGGILMR